MSPTKAAHQKFSFPAWVVVIIWATACGASLLWASSLYDEHGDPLLDNGTVTVIIALIGVVGTGLTLVFQKQKSVEHELHPNSGASARDAIDRIEALAEESKVHALEAKHQAEHAVRAAREANRNATQTRTEVQQVRTDLTDARKEIRTDVTRIVDLLLEQNKENAK